jgi:hypothetical protein
MCLPVAPYGDYDGLFIVCPAGDLTALSGLLILTNVSIIHNQLSGPNKRCHSFPFFCFDFWIFYFSRRYFVLQICAGLG